MQDMANVYLPNEAIEHITQSIFLRVEKAILHANYNDDDDASCSNSWKIYNSFEDKYDGITTIGMKCTEKLSTGYCLLYQVHTLNYMKKIYMEGRSGIIYSEDQCSFFLRPSHGVMAGFPSRLLKLKRARKTIKYTKERVGSIIQTR